MPAEPAVKTRLTSWKEVAGFFGKAERTVMRWEAERGLPVHRLPGEARSSIYADIAELETWLRGAAAEAAPQPLAAATVPAPPDVVPPAMAPPHFWSRPRGRAAIISCMIGAILAVSVTHMVRHALAPPSAVVAPPPAAAKSLYIKALQDWAGRTPPSLNRAVDEFSAAIRIYPAYAEACVGLANSYILLREYAAMPSAQAYSLAKAAAARAIALKPGLAGAHAAYGFALLYGDWRFAEGLAEFEHALQLEPDNPGLQHWYATALMAVGQHGAALVHIERALELDPGAREVQADRALILFSQGRYDEARGLLTQLTAESPAFLSPHAYLAVLALATADDGMFLREEALRAHLQHDTQGAAIARAAQAGYEAGGHTGMLRMLIEARLAALAAGTGSASSVARAYAAAGDRQQTLAYLNRAIDRRDENAFADIDNSMYRTLLGDVALAPLRTRLALPN